MPTFEGDFSPPPGRFAVVAARFNATVTAALLDGCRDALSRHGVGPDRLDVAWVPGSFEIPVVAKSLADTGRYAAVVCLGCVIRGDTGHYDHVAGQTAAGVLQAGLSTGVPVIFGVLTTDTVEQALNRAGLKGGNKGADAALAAIEMANLMSGLKEWRIAEDARWRDECIARANAVCEAGLAPERPPSD
jgi:6,7-dimethyl-8-ribityllumazine synthase